MPLPCASIRTFDTETPDRPLSAVPTDGALLKDVANPVTHKSSKKTELVRSICSGVLPLSRFYLCSQRMLAVIPSLR
jgi:hypothetical protein